MIENPLISKSTWYYYNPKSRIMAIFWGALAVVALMALFLGTPWGDVKLPAVVVSLFASYNLKRGYRALVKLPVICFTSNDFEFHGAGGQTVEGIWRDVDFINDEPTKDELYFHYRAEAPVTLITSGLAASHEEVKAVAKAYLIESNREH